MKLDKKVIAKLSRLSKISLKEEEIDSLSKDLSNILAYIEQLNEVATENIVPTQQVTGLVNVLRTDIADYTFEKSDMVSTMPEVDENGALKVRAVFTEDSPSH
ncbi:MAG: hypothetical protein A2233_02120 [Candidatus Kerfeldbacteria bacterium RIFOXYA2_FULL_38_24]|uniref:Aspartyl/glutamyl-tRNA(Asn/Gln) amidotransferase subunit C n=1 Tax=Candidatus Kerfeldbacteria bacterium RIFOXYB2_FULL_38_14 TaxID=1798547 RepID=A0A1G2BET1_9BACT|nr:MAG: hypothetical protein A2319_04720 [Candidatus Kerfeldbacteria bacterium RIFOXYB2_FULL_38_14]OGY87911.1 MAG: hypothetical protein A2233_02120 [Candidatus Kerfeldbacteria bacterium RIFOXYA2_FULL_38_24]OGY88674.1 MAG: hypothetical protein A2458_03485 [Candidatus Kerfeldbacteria bacterium RIFOXYC2_FULL_38_9]